MGTSVDLKPGHFHISDQARIHVRWAATPVEQLSLQFCPFRGVTPNLGDTLYRGSDSNGEKTTIFKGTVVQRGSGTAYIAGESRCGVVVYRRITQGGGLPGKS